MKKWIYSHPFKFILILSLISLLCFISVWVFAQPTIIPTVDHAILSDLPFIP